ncbi:MAG: hypothetical protein ACYS5F_15680 [Planctomycetota bacterium]|jgi:hypothetical protein
MKLLTEEIKKKLPPLYAQEQNLTAKILSLASLMVIAGNLATSAWLNFKV